LTGDGLPSPRQVWFDVNILILEVIVLVRSGVHRQRVALQTDLAADLPRVLGDRIQVPHVLLNLLVNAIDALHGVTRARA
jgi:C4-dicarboxylate-specific signal transduction histidine kinase